MPFTTKIDPAVKRRALELADEHGYPFASEQTGVPQSTIRKWRSREISRPHRVPKDEQAVAIAEQKLDELRKVANHARIAAEKATREDKSQRAKDFLVNYAICIDKIKAFEEHLERLPVQRAELSKAQGRAVASLLAAFLRELELPPAPELIGELVRQAEAGKRPKASPEVAKTARDRIEAEIGRRIAKRVPLTLSEPKLTLPPPAPKQAPEKPQEPAPQPSRRPRLELIQPQRPEPVTAYVG